MKRALACLIALTLAVGTLTACGSTSGKPSPGAKEESEEEKSAADKGSVYYLNFKPEQNGQWQELAEIYSDATGVPVTVVTAASGEYEDTLMKELGTDKAPTLFQVNGPVGLKIYQDYCYDLTGSTIASKLTSDAFALYDDDGAMDGIAYVIESYGIITNTALLKQAGYSVDDIKCFADLKRVAEDITARRNELGFSAFTSAGMDSSSDWRFKTHLANLPVYFEYQKDGISKTAAIKGTYLDNFRAIWDLYINNSTCQPGSLADKGIDDARSEFVSGRAVFYQNGSWEYGNLLKEGMNGEDMQMIPIYFGVGDEARQGLCTGTENYWCVNALAGEKDIQATIDFISWCVTTNIGVHAMCGGNAAMVTGAPGMRFVIPFRNALEPENIFALQDKKNTEEGKVPVAWSFQTMPSEDWKDGVGAALTAYANDQTDENWKAVVTAFVDGWAAEYDRAN